MVALTVAMLALVQSGFRISDDFSLRSNSPSVEATVPKASHMQSPASLITNGDFAQPVDGTWTQTGITEAAPVDVAGNGFSRAWRLSANPRPGADPFEAGVSQTTKAPVRAGETVTFHAWMRSPTRSNVAVVFETTGAWNSRLFFTIVRLTPAWKEVRFAGVMPQNLAPGAAQISIQLGYAPGTVEVANVELENVGVKPLKDLDLKVDYYGGKANPDGWRKAALARIEKIRKGDLTVRVVDEGGKPVRNATVSVEQTRHAFHFGTAAPAAMLLRNDETGQKFRSTLERLFNTVTFENDTKWNRLGEPNYATVDAAVDWLHTHGFDVRGHNLVWGGKRWLPGGLWDKSDPEVVQAVKDRIASATAHFRGKVYIWDVVNEAVTQSDLWDRIGWDKFVDAYRWAHAGDPNAQLAYNDYDLTEENSAGPSHLRVAEKLLDRLVAAKAPLDVIGVQAHINVPITPTARVLEILHELDRYGKKLEITEYDLGALDDEVHGKHMADFMTACFSHPSVQAFVMWGFWEGSHWRAVEGGAMFRRDWTPRPAALAYEDLVKRQWWTRANLKTNARGEVHLRAFYGTHRVTVGGSSETVTLEPGHAKNVTIALKTG